MYQRLGDLFFSQRLGSFEDDASTIAAPNATPKQHTKHHRKWKLGSTKKDIKKMKKKMKRILYRRDYLTKLRNDTKITTAQRSRIDQELIKIAKIIDRYNARCIDLKQKVASVNETTNPSIPTVQVNKEKITVTTPPAPAPAPNLQGFGEVSGYSKLLIVGLILAAGAGAFHYYKKHKAAMAARRKRRKK